MNYKIPDNFMGKPVEGAMEKVLANQTAKSQPQSQSSPEQSVNVPANINPADYVRIPGTTTLISKYEQFKGLKWEPTHFKLAENGLFMPTPALFMPYFLNVVKAHEKKVALHDGNGTFLSEKEIEDIYKHLTTNHIDSGAYSWLDAKFSKVGDDCLIESDHKVINKTELKGKKAPLENCLWDDCLVELIFNSQGLPTQKSTAQKYQQGKNIYFYHPRDGAVARFVADSGGAFLSCDRNPDFSYSSLGVFSCAEGTQKNQKNKGT